MMKKQKAKTVHTKKELKAALTAKEKVIIVENNKLCSDLKPILKVMKLSPQKRKVIIKLLATSGALLVASIAAMPVTQGVSALSTAPAVVACATSAGVSIPTVVGVLILCVSVGVTMVLEIFHHYEVDYEIEYKGVVFRRKARIGKDV